MRSVNFTANNHVALLHCGAEFFPALVHAFDAAQHEIYLETYIFSGDTIGGEIKAALSRAARRGVMVNVIADWLGTGQTQNKLHAVDFLQAGVNFRVFNPWFSRGLARTHRKLCVVDGAVAFIGGLNINDDYHCDFDADIVLPTARWDFAVRVEGPLVPVIHREITAQWRRIGRMKLKARWQNFRELRRRAGPPDIGGPAHAGLVVRDNLRNRRTIQRAYLQALGHARKSVVLANPYFAPGRKLRDALASAAARGVEVTLLLGVGQFRLQDSVAHAFYPALLKSGVKVVEYSKTQLHGKVAVVDDDWATVGSSNYDGLSLFVNQEANIVIKDAAFARSLRRHIERGIADGVPVAAQDFASLAWYKRAWYGCAYLVYKNILRVVTLGRYTE